MPQLKDRQRNAIQALTDRKLEALAMLCLGRTSRSRYAGIDGTRSNMGGAANRMLDELQSAHLVNRDGITWAGVEGVLLNIGRVPVQWREEVKAAALKLQPELAAKTDQAEAELERQRQEREERAQRREAERQETIPVKLRELAARHGLVISDDSGREEPFNGQMVSLWDAIVNADQGL